MAKQNSQNEAGDILPGNVTKSQVDTWKEEHKEVHLITIKKDEEGKECAYIYVKKPDRQTLAAAMKFMTSDIVKFQEILFNNCLLGGDSEVKTRDELFFAAAQKIVGLFQIREAEIVKL